MITLACPVCHGSGCSFCTTLLIELCKDNLPDLIPPSILRDPRHAFEIGRYDAIEKAGLESYADYAPTKPKFRAALMAGILEDYNVQEYVNIGPGFGFLEVETPGMDRWALDHSLGFLNATRERAPGTRCVRAVAELLPIATESVPCLVSDSTFQTMVDREAFLCEAARVCVLGALLVLTIAYRVHYPRKPQGGFNVLHSDGRDMLRHYLNDLGFDVAVEYLNTKSGLWSQDIKDADYMYIMGNKQ